MGNENLKIVEYSKSKNHYAVLVENAFMKNPQTREWERCVIYEQHKELNDVGEYIEIPEKDKKTFVREYNEFWKKFELCLDL